MAECTSVGGMRVLLAVYALLGRGVFMALVWPVVLYHYLSHPVARRASRDYLRRLNQTTGALGGPPARRHVLRHFALFASTLLDRVLAACQRYPADAVTFTGREALLTALKEGRGAVLVTAHMGCLEVCQALSQQRAVFKLTILVHNKHALRLHAYLQGLRPTQSVQLLEVTELTPATCTLLAARAAAGDCIVIAGDRVPVGGGATVQVPFLGASAPFPTGPYVLAAVLRCPLFSMVCTHGGRGYEVHLAALADRVLLPRGQRLQGAQPLAEMFAARLTQHLGTAPFDWFNFYPFWAQDVACQAPR